MNALASIVLIGWIPVVLLLFAILPPRRAVVVAYLAAWLFLPNIGFGLPGLPDFTKVMATSVGVLLGALLFDSGRILAFRPRWADLPMLAWCLCPFASSISNDLGAYDGTSAVVNQAVTYGLPYFIGRVYLGDREGLAELALGIVAGGLIYVPLCLLEIRISPQLHRIVYGAAARSDFSQTMRYGGYRPTVFMVHGLEVGMWMASATLIACWLRAGGAVKRFGRYPFGPLVAVLLTTAALCKSLGAILQMILGLAVLWASRRFRTVLPALALAAVAPLYCGLRTSGLWDGRVAVAYSQSAFGGDRGQSLEFRLDNEDMLMAKALQRPAFGWGGWGRARVYNDEGKDLTVTDGLWIIALGNYGLVGLASQLAILILPIGLLIARCPARRWGDPDVAPAAALAVLLALYMIDNLSNAMVNPIYYLAAGALSSPGAWLAGAGSGGIEPLPAELLAIRREAGLLEAEAAAGSRGWGDAERAWAEAIRLEGSPIIAASLGLTDALGHRALCLARLGASRKAVEVREQALNLLTAGVASAPGNLELARALSVARNDLAWLLVTAADGNVRDPARAVELAASAVQFDPDSASHQSTLGAALVRAGRPSDGVVAIMRSLAIRRGGGSAYDHLFLAIAHLKIGDAGSAQGALARVDDAATRAMLTRDADLDALRSEIAAILTHRLDAL